MLILAAACADASALCERHHHAAKDCVAAADPNPDHSNWSAVYICEHASDTEEVKALRHCEIDVFEATDCADPEQYATVAPRLLECEQRYSWVR